MPVQCEIQFPRISDEEMKAFDYRVMKHVFATHNELGCLADESIYQRELLRRLSLEELESVIEVPLYLSFRSLTIPLRLDMVVGNQVVYELKTVSSLSPGHQSQLLVYLYLTNSTHGKLVNFLTRSVESRFVNTTLDVADRRKFQFEPSQYTGPECFSSLVRELVEDWGTGLEGSLYRRAILHCAGVEGESEQLLPMRSGNALVGNQRFHLLDAETAIAVTTFREHLAENRRDVEKLIRCSPLKQFHWINIVHHRVEIETISRD